MRSASLAFATWSASALDARFKYKDGDLVADTPTDPADQIDPDTLIFAYTPVEDPAVYAQVWDGFLKHLESVTGKANGQSAPVGLPSIVTGMAIWPIRFRPKALIIGLAPVGAGPRQAAPQRGQPGAGPHHQRAAHRAGHQGQRDAGPQGWPDHYRVLR